MWLHYHVSFGILNKNNLSIAQNYDPATKIKGEIVCDPIIKITEGCSIGMPRHC